jgi:metal-sulfur cluster biosynthetic enzyme
MCGPWLVVVCQEKPSRLGLRKLRLLAIAFSLFYRTHRIHQQPKSVTIRRIELLQSGLYAMAIHISFQQNEVYKMSKLEDQVREEVGKVQDPETGQSFAEMQMIQSVKETAPGEFTVEFVPTSPFCPIAFKLAADIKAAAKSVPGVKKAVVYCRGHAMEQQINEMTNKE